MGFRVPHVHVGVVGVGTLAAALRGERGVVAEEVGVAGALGDEKMEGLLREGGGGERRGHHFLCTPVDDSLPKYSLRNYMYV